MIDMDYILQTCSFPVITEVRPATSHDTPDPRHVIITSIGDIVIATLGCQREDGGFDNKIVDRINTIPPEEAGPVVHRAAKTGQITTGSLVSSQSSLPTDDGCANPHR